MKFIAIKFLQFLLGIIILILTFTDFGTFGKYGGGRDPQSGFIIDPASEERTRNGLILWNGALRPIVAANTFQMILLGISRFSGFFMYPALILVFFSKFRATGAILATTPFSMFMIEDMHKLHVYCGWIILLDSTVHTIAHITRWMDQDNIYLLFSHKSGISGIVASLSLLVVVLPMAIWQRNRIKYEIRKALHYMFLVMAFALCFHTSPSSIPNGGFSTYIFATLLVWYALDALYCSFFMTELIQTTVYQTLSTGVQMTMKVSKRFQDYGENGGYGYVCFPWVDRNQWHAFSLYENPLVPEERQIFMQKVGDWTEQVHGHLQRSSVRPVWIQGPFPSPYSSSIQYDNQILVASGIGITPALSVIRSHKSSRRLNLIWAVRDPAMLEFYLEKAYLDHCGWNLIFYTGKKPLVSSTLDRLNSTNVCVVKARPNLAHVIPNIIYGVESGEGLPENYMLDNKEAAIKKMSLHLDELDSEGNLTTAEKMRKLADMAKNLGYVFQDLMGQMGQVFGNIREEAIDVEMGQEEEKQTATETSCCMIDGSSNHSGDDLLLNVLRSNHLRRLKTQRNVRNLGYERSDHEYTALEMDVLGPDSCSSSSAEESGSDTSQESDEDREEEDDDDNDKEKIVPLDQRRKRFLHSAKNNSSRSSMGRKRFHRTASRASTSSTTTGSTTRRIYQRTNNERSILRHGWNSIVEDLVLEFKPWEEILKAEPYVKALDKKKILSTWGVLYCGGRNPLLANLKKVTKEYGIELHSEAFDW